MGAVAVGRGLQASRLGRPQAHYRCVDSRSLGFILSIKRRRWHCSFTLTRAEKDTNDLSILKRKPSDLRRYISWTAETKAKYGTITEYILQNRLPKAWGLPPFTPESQVPFAAASDYKVLLNDWPYGLAPGITHIVVWTRTQIPTDPESGDLTVESRAQVETFVNDYFIKKLGLGGEHQVLWFKNWVALQSVRTLEHFHVLVRDVDDDMLERWTGERPRRE